MPETGRQIDPDVVFQVIDKPTGFLPIVLVCGGGGTEYVSGVKTDPHKRQNPAERIQIVVERLVGCERDDAVGQ